MKNKTVFALTIFWAVVSCNPLANHEHDGLYVGATLVGIVGYVVDGNEVTIYHRGTAHREPIEYGEGYLKLKSNGAIFHVLTDSDTGEKSLVVKEEFMDLKFVFITPKTDMTENKVNELITEAVRGKR